MNLIAILNTVYTAAMCLSFCIVLCLYIRSLCFIAEWRNYHFPYYA